MPLKVTAIFDIGKTNKKFFLFDEQLNEVFQEYVRFPEIADDDGFASDDLGAITGWMLSTFQAVRSSGEYEITAINFSAYGATMVHLDESLKPCTPLYNYTKAYPADTLKKFVAEHGEINEWSLKTASPSLGMLNAGLQLFWLKHKKPDLFSRIRYSVFLPQYFSFLFSKELVGEYTGVGCHTGIWDFEQKDLHEWIYDEGFDRLLPFINKTDHDVYIPGTNIKVGAGIHDSSAALIPYMENNKEPFLLLSTGTWSICLNPFNHTPLTQAELAGDCLCYLKPNGEPVKASRLFLGSEYNEWMKKMAAHFGVDAAYHKTLAFEPRLLERAEQSGEQRFYKEGITLTGAPDSPALNVDLTPFRNFTEAYHQLMMELVELQVEKIALVMSPGIDSIFLDGGFIDNHIFVKMLAHKLIGMRVVPSEIPLGSAVGAAMSVNRGEILI